MCTDTQTKKHAKILFNVKSAKDRIIKLFKTTGYVSPATSNFAVSSIEQRGARDVHPSPSLMSMAQSFITRICVVTVRDLLPSGPTQLKPSLPSSHTANTWWRSTSMTSSPCDANLHCYRHWRSSLLSQNPNAHLGLPSLLAISLQSRRNQRAQWSMWKRCTWNQDFVQHTAHAHVGC